MHAHTRTYAPVSADPADPPTGRRRFLHTRMVRVRRANAGESYMRLKGQEQGARTSMGEHAFLSLRVRRLVLRWSLASTLPSISAAGSG